MRFIALVKNQLREVYGWLIAVAVIFTLLGGFILWRSIAFYTPWSPTPGERIWPYNLFQYPEPLTRIGPVLIGASCILGLLLAAQQFLRQNIRKTWSFTIHRSVERSTILWAKFSAAILAFILCLGLEWTLFFLYVLKSGVFSYPPTLQTLIEGWIFILLGLVVYFGGVLSSVSTKKKYTTRFFGVIFAGVILILSFMRLNLVLCLTVIITAIVILVSDIIDSFLSREF
jgi:hypothetical protein